MTQLILSLTTLTLLSMQTHARAATTGARHGRVMQADVRRVDFRNFRYRDWGEEIRITRGRGTYKEASDTDFAYSIDRVKVVYGDLTGDGREEAAVVLYYNGGGTGAFSRCFIFGVRKGRLDLLAIFQGGDRADGGIREVSIKDGILSIQHNEPERLNGVASGLCCPVYWITKEYRFEHGSFAPFGKPRKVEAVPDSQ